MILVERFSSPECRLCDEARTVLKRVRKTLPFTLSEIRLHEGMLRTRLQQMASGGSRPATEEEANSGELLP